MPRRAPITLRRGNDLFTVHDDTYVKHLLFPTWGEDAVESCVSRVHKMALSRFELAAGQKFSGVGQAIGATRKRFSKQDAAVVKSARALGEAFGFIRHLTTLGEEVWLSNLASALGRLSPLDSAMNGGPEQHAGGGSLSTPAAGKHKKKKKRNRRGRKGGEGGESDFDDRFADTLSMPARASSSLVALAFGPPTFSDSAAGSTRVLRVRHSGSRSPPPARGMVVPANASTPAGPAIGDFAIVTGLQSKPALNGQKAKVISYNAGTSRYGCTLVTGEQVALRKESIMVLHGAFADSARALFAGGG